MIFLAAEFGRPHRSELQQRVSAHFSTYDHLKHEALEEVWFVSSSLERDAIHRSFLEKFGESVPCDVAELSFLPGRKWLSKNTWEWLSRRLPTRLQDAGLH